MSAVPAPILIAGGGICGLATAIALAVRGRRTHVLEKAQAFSEAGAGIQIGPNGVHVLEALGVAPLLQAAVAVPDCVQIVDGTTARTLTRLPLGTWIANRHGAPYWTVHRADLQAALLTRAAAEPHIKITLGTEVRDVVDVVDGVEAKAADGQTFRGSALIGADGVWSRRRRDGAPASMVTFAKMTAARCLIPVEDLPPRHVLTDVSLWLAPHAHVVQYPVRAGRALAAIVVFPDDMRSETGDAESSADTVRAQIANFATGALDHLKHASGWRAWSLFEGRNIWPWGSGCTTMAGDAAHPILPFFAQGGVLALEDAATLAEALADDCVPVAAALRTYESRRRRRVDRIAAASRRNGQIFHVRGLAAAARNLYLRGRAPEQLMAANDWLYGWHPDRPDA